MLFDDLIINSEYFSNIASILAVFFGFYITSLSLFSNSSYAKNLYLKEDDNGKTTAWHELIEEFKISIYITLFSLIVSVFGYTYCNLGLGKIYSINNIFLSIYFGLIGGVLWSSFRLVNRFISFVLQSGKNS